jgi:hypothetical protein
MYEAARAKCTEEQFRVAMYEDPEPSAAWLAERTVDPALAKRVRATASQISGEGVTHGSVR